jgi:hypothetical protein
MTTEDELSSLLNSADEPILTVGDMWILVVQRGCWKLLRLVSDVEILISGLSYHRKAWRPAEFKVSFYTA